MANNMTPTTIPIPGSSTGPSVVVNVNNAMNELQSMWGIPTQHIQNIQKEISIVNTKHGLLSGVPILCKGDDCPYINTCRIPQADRIVGNRCPQEIAALLVRFEQLCTEFEIHPDDSVDMGQIKELVDLEIMMLRCDNKMAFDANFIERSIKDIAKNGKVLYEDKISQAVELKLQLIEKHSKILKDLNGTRDSKKEQNITLDPSQEAANLIQKAKEIDAKLRAMPIEVLDSDFLEVTDDDMPDTNNEVIDKVSEEEIYAE